MVKAVKDAMWLIGVLVTASALISAIQAWGEISLAAIMGEFLQMYRSITAPVMQIVYLPARALLSAIGLHVVIPQFVHDLHVVSFVGAGIWLRGLSRASLPIRVVAWLLYGLTFLGVLVLLEVIVVMVTPRGISENSDRFDEELKWRLARLPDGERDDGAISRTRAEALIHVRGQRMAVAAAGWSTIVAVALFYVLNSTLLGVNA